MDKLLLSPEEYEAATQAYREQYDYDSMSDSQKEQFDRKLDQAVGIREADSADTEGTDSTDSGDESGQDSETENFRKSMREQCSYEDMTDSQKEDFDRAFDHEMGLDSEGSDREVNEKAEQSSRTLR